MRRLLVQLMLLDALFASTVSTAAGGSDNATGLVFASLGVAAWVIAFGINEAWDA